MPSPEPKLSECQIWAMIHPRKTHKLQSSVVCMPRLTPKGFCYELRVIGGQQLLSTLPATQRLSAWVGSSVVCPTFAHARSAGDPIPLRGAVTASVSRKLGRPQVFGARDDVRNTCRYRLV